VSPETIIGAIVIGAIIGVLGRLVLPGRQRIPVWLTVVVGIVAALLGTALANAVGVKTTNGIDWIEIVFQVGLAVVGVAVADRFYGRKGVGSGRSSALRR
jgi:uncharacterized membrane protein YeaQ/YmgE (transglycosylase-associated protein family)